MLTTLDESVKARNKIACGGVHVTVSDHQLTPEHVLVHVVKVLDLWRVN